MDRPSVFERVKARRRAVLEELDALLPAEREGLLDALEACNRALGVSVELDDGGVIIRLRRPA